jgi:hypothetical protein
MREQYKRIQMPRSKADLAVLVQSRISRAAERSLSRRLSEEALTESAYIRRLIYKDLKIIKEDA